MKDGLLHLNIFLIRSRIAVRRVDVTLMRGKSCS